MTAQQEPVAALAASAPPVDTSPMYKALIEARLALLAVNSFASQVAIGLIDKVLNAAPDDASAPALQAGQGEVTDDRLIEALSGIADENIRVNHVGDLIEAGRAILALASPTHERAAPAPEPVYWESRWLDTANMPHTWSEWQRCEPRNPYTDTAADKAREIQGYIDAGYKYELRALYASPSQPAEGVREPMTWPEIDEAARRAQISFCLDKKPSFEIALVREVEAHHGIASGSAESKGDGK